MGRYPSVSASGYWKFMTLNDPFPLNYGWDLCSSSRRENPWDIVKWKELGEGKWTQTYIFDSTKQQQGRQSCWHIPLGVRHWVDWKPERNETRDSGRWEVSVSSIWTLNLLKEEKWVWETEENNSSLSRLFIP